MTQRPEWVMLHPDMTMAHLGYLPGWLDLDDPRPAAKQLDEGYVFGGWRPSALEFGMTVDYVLRYPGDPPIKPLAYCLVRDEVVVFYPSSWVAIVQPGRQFEMCRMD